MKIGVNTLFLIPGEVGGSETYLCETLRALGENHPDTAMILFTNIENHDVLKERFAAFAQFEYRRLDFRATNRYARILREQLELPLVVARAGVDLLWSPGYTAALCARGPQVVTIHDMQYKTHPQDLAPLARCTTDVLVRLAARCCTRIIAVSEFARSEILRHTSAPGAKVDVVYEAADPSFAEKIPAAAAREVRERLLKFDGPYLFCAANTYPHKNVAALVDAFGRLCGAIPHRLVLAGKPRLGEAAVETALVRLPDRSRVVRLDLLSRADLTALYQNAEAFVFPSLYEGFGLPVLEAMMAGVPVITTRMASIPEVGGDHVRYFDEKSPEDLAAKIREVVAMKPAECAEWCRRASLWAKTFSWKRTAEETVECFRRAVNHR